MCYSIGFGQNAVSHLIYWSPECHRLHCAQCLYYKPLRICELLCFSKLVYLLTDKRKGTSLLQNLYIFHKLRIHKVVNSQAQVECRSVECCSILQCIFQTSVLHLERSGRNMQEEHSEGPSVQAHQCLHQATRLQAEGL